MIKKIKLWWDFEGRYYHKDFIRGIKNLIKWFPVIWKDRDWDYYNTLSILKFKLQQQSRYIESAKMFIGWGCVVRDMNLAVKLIDIISDDKYSDEMHEYYESKFEFIPTDETKKWFSVETTEIYNNLQAYFDKYPKIYAKYKDKGDKYYVAILMSGHLQEKAKRILFKMLDYKLLNWWN